MFFDNKPSQASSSASTPGSSTSTATSRRAENQDGSDRKRRRVQRACDMCRLKKVKCEGGHPSRKACTNCVVNKYDCTYMQMARLEVRDKAHVRNLEARLAKMEQFVRKFAPDLDAAQDLLDVQPSPVASAKSPAASAASAEPHGAHTPISMDESDFDSDEEEAGTRKTIEDYLQGLSITPALPSLVGKSSALMLVRTVLESKPPELGQQRSPQLPLSESPSAYGHLSGNVTRFWESHTWESRPSGPKHQFTFPEPDLLPILVNNYFQEHNVDSPLLHRPTFERNMARGLHFSDEGFGAVLLLVCALGSRHTEDPRTFAADEEYSGLPGGRWFLQVRRTLSIIHLETPRLYDLQIAALSSSYLTRTANPQITCWLMVGHGIKMAQVVGAHRKKVYAMMPPVERELLKRVFWILVKADRELSYYLGRPCTMQDEDFDVDLPLECDDEYWQPDDPSKAFMQPGGKPSNITYFNWALKLSQIQSYALRTIYSITKARVTLGHIGSQWEEKIVMELDSALNQWLDTLPEHLRWNPKEPDFAALTHTAGLHSGFYNLQMIVHRPFLSPRRQKTTAFPSLTICTNAARAALRILDVQYTRAKGEGKAGVGAIGTILVAGIILLLSVIGQKRAGSNTATLQADADLIQKAVYMIMAHSAGSPAIRQGGNSLCELMRVAGLPVPRESDSPYFHSSTSSQWQGADTDTSAQQQLNTNAPIVDSRTLDTTMAAAPTVHPDPWNSHPQFSANSFSSAAMPSNSQPQHMTNTFPHTDEDMGGFGYAFGNPAQAPPPFEFQWAGAGVGVGVGEGGGFADVPGFQWGEWGSLFASALGDGEGFDFDGSNGGGEGFGFGGAGGNGDGRGQ